MMVPIHNLSVEYGIRTVKQTYGNNFNDVAEVSNGLWVSLAIPYIDIRIIEDVGWCDSRNVNNHFF